MELDESIDKGFSQHIELKLEKIPKSLNTSTSPSAML